jgi:cysteine desulfurase family protein
MVIYLNNAATSFPKPRCVIAAVNQTLLSPPSNPYRQNSENENTDRLCRKRLAELFNVPSSERIVLCSGSTEALNIAIHGLVKEDGHVVTTTMEHNSALRPLFLLRDQGKISLDILPCNPKQALRIKDLENLIGKDTCLMVVNHASNVTGCLQSIDEIHELAARYQIPFILDVSQSAGAVALDLARLDWAVVAFTGHKSLLGPTGTGGLIVGKNIDLNFWKVGGTGIRSDLESMPDLWPLKYEPGTPNHSGIAGLAAAVDFLLENKTNPAFLQKQELVKQVWSDLKQLKGIHLYSEEPKNNPCGVIAFNLDGWRCKDLGYVLAESYEIQVRTGLHCAPLIHHAMGTFPEGTVRASLSPFTTGDEIEIFQRAMREIAGTA